MKTRCHVSGVFCSTISGQSEVKHTVDTSTPILTPPPPPPEETKGKHVTILLLLLLIIISSSSSISVVNVFIVNI